MVDPRVAASQHENRQILIGHVVERRSELSAQADKLADGDPELREVLRFQTGA